MRNQMALFFPHRWASASSKVEPFSKHQRCGRNERGSEFGLFCLYIVPPIFILKKCWFIHGGADSTHPKDLRHKHHYSALISSECKQSQQSQHTGSSKSDTQHHGTHLWAVDMIFLLSWMKKANHFHLNFHLAGQQKNTNFVQFFFFLASLEIEKCIEIIFGGLLVLT